MTTQRERDEFFILLARAIPDASCATVQNFARRIMRAAGRHRRYCEAYCSFPAPDGSESYWRDRIDAAKAEAVAAVAHFNAPFEVVCQNDPRGCTLKLGHVQRGEDFERFIYPPARGLPASAYSRR